LAALAAAACGMAAVPALAAPVAGLAPYQRPADAPAIKQFAPGESWRAAALRGVEPPPAESVLRMLDSQGAWFTPFIRPGMPGPYDLRRLHETRPTQAGR
jgi:hypothetical protein